MSIEDGRSSHLAASFGEARSGLADPGTSNALDLGKGEPEAASSDLRESGDRLEGLLARLEAQASPAMWADIGEAMSLITGLYGAALARMAELSGPDAVRLWAGDDLVASLLVVHDLHPDSLARRVEAALDGVRPYLGSHGGDVSLEGVDPEAGEVVLRMLGSCDGCPSSSVTLKLAVEGAILAAAPEVSTITVVDDPTHQHDPTPPHVEVPRPGVESPVSLGRKPPGEQWMTTDQLTDLDGSGVRLVSVGGVDVVVCAVRGGLYAYRASCPACGGSLDGADLQDEVLRCPTCAAAFHARLAGRGLDGGPEHLDPIPLLEGGDGGQVRIAVPS